MKAHHSRQLLALAFLLLRCSVSEGALRASRPVARRSALHMLPAIASSLQLHGFSAPARAAELPPVVDLSGVFSSRAPELDRLMRILTALESDTGYKIRVVTLSASARADPQTITQAKQAWQVGGSTGRVDPNAVVIVADRGIPGSLEAGNSYLRYEVGSNVQFVLPDIFWGRLQREYGKRAFVEARGEAASVRLRRIEPTTPAPWWAAVDRRERGHPAHRCADSASIDHHVVRARAHVPAQRGGVHKRAVRRKLLLLTDAERCIGGMPGLT